MWIIFRDRFLKKNCGNAEFERRMREDRGAEGTEGVGIYRFWCKLSAFCTVLLKLV